MKVGSWSDPFGRSSYGRGSGSSTTSLDDVEADSIKIEEVTSSSLNGRSRCSDVQ
jgi:hypothetical protein